MGDLISRQEFVKDIIRRCGCVPCVKGWHGKTIYMSKVIEEQPTAFDLESVIERLQTELSLSDKEKERCARENPLQFDEAKGYSCGMAVSFEILKSAANATNGKIGETE